MEADKQHRDVTFFLEKVGEYGLEIIQMDDDSGSANGMQIDRRSLPKLINVLINKLNEISQGSTSNSTSE